LRVSFSNEAQQELLRLCRRRDDQPITIVHWREPTADISRASDGSSVVERVPGQGNVEVISGNGKVPASSIEIVQDIPIFLDTLPDDEYCHLYVSFTAGLFTVQRDGT